MDLKHFGDSYDVVKQSLLGWLAPRRTWSAHPMFTHNVSAKRAKAFGKFLGVHLVSRARLIASTDREAYFDVCLRRGHLFLDPDTGLRMDGHGNDPKYLHRGELLGLAKARRGYLTMTFDQSLSRARDAKAQVKEKLRYLRRKRLAGFAYVSHVAFIVVGCNPTLVKRARETFLRRSRLPRQRIVLSG